MFRVRVVDKDDRPIKNKNVSLGFHGLTRGMSNDEFTDDDGVATFDGYKEGGITVYISGDNYGDFYYEDGGEVTICYEYDTW